MNLVTAEHLTKSYTERLLFDDTGFSIQEGDKIGLIGINGTGKSTLLRMTAGLEEPERSADPSQMYYSRARYMGPHCQGQTEVDMDGIGPTIRAEHHGNIEYRRLSEEHGGTLRGELERGLRERRLTPRECALIQTFPPDYEFVIPKEGSGRQFVLSPSAAYKIIGNAVPPLLAYHIARRVQALWPIYFK